MARDRTTRTTRSRWPIRLQDHGGIDREILQLINATIINPLVERISELEREVAGLGGLRVHTAELELHGARSGSVVLEGEFGEGAIGAPVVVTQAMPASPDEAEFGIVQFVGMVLSTSRLRIEWFAPGDAPDKTAIHFLIGTREEF
jgi:hypothetical protein